MPDSHCAIESPRLAPGAAAGRTTRTLQLTVSFVSLMVVIFPASGGAIVAYVAVLWDSPRVMLALLLGWVATAIFARHLTGTTYRGGIMPSRLLDVSSRLVALVLMTYALLSLVPEYFARAWPLFLLYAITYLDGSERDGSRFSPTARKYDGIMATLVKRLISGPNDVQPRVLADGGVPLPPDGQYVLGMHPHGLFPLGLLMNMGTDFTGCPGSHGGLRAQLYAAATFCFYVPFMREVFLHWGVIDASRPVLDAMLSRVRAIAGRTEDHSVLVCLPVRRAISF